MRVSPYQNPTAYAFAQKKMNAVELRPSERVVFEAIACLIERDKSSVVLGYDAIQANAKSGISLVTVKRAMARLKELGLVRVTYRYNLNGKRTQSDIAICGLFSHISTRKLLRRNKPTKYHTKYQNDTASIYKGDSSKNFVEKRARRLKVSCHVEGDLHDPVTGELLPTVGGLQ